MCFSDLFIEKDTNELYEEYKKAEIMRINKENIDKQESCFNETNFFALTVYQFQEIIHGHGSQHSHQRIYTRFVGIRDLVVGKNKKQGCIECNPDIEISQPDPINEKHR
jgi:hypothetical protein